MHTPMHTHAHMHTCILHAHTCHYAPVDSQIHTHDFHIHKPMIVSVPAGLDHAAGCAGHPGLVAAAGPAAAAVARLREVSCTRTRTHAHGCVMRNSFDAVVDGYACALCTRTGMLCVLFTSRSHLSSTQNRHDSHIMGVFCVCVQVVSASSH